MRIMTVTFDLGLDPQDWRKELKQMPIRKPQALRRETLHLDCGQALRLPLYPWLESNIR